MHVHYLSHGAATGYGEAGARLVRALLGAGHEVTWTPITFDGEALPWPDDRRTVFPDLETRRRSGPTPCDVAVVHAVPELLPTARRLVDGRGPLLVHTVWETTQLQPHWPALLAGADGAIVPTAWNRTTFERGGVARVAVVPHVAPDPAAAVDTEWLPDRPGFVVYTIAEWQPRKAPWRTVEAYAEAFEPDDDVLLVLKTGPRIWNMLVDDPSPRADRTSWALARLLGRLGRVPPIHLVDDFVPPDQLAGLHQWADCWLSLPHGEGWDLGAFAAAVGGNRVVTTGWGAPAEYLSADAAWLLPVDEVPVPSGPDVRHGEVPGSWAEPDMGAAVAALRSAAAGERRAEVAAQAERLRREHAPDVVAARFVAAVDDLLG